MRVFCLPIKLSHLRAVLDHFLAESSVWKMIDGNNTRGVRTKSALISKNGDPRLIVQLNIQNKDARVQGWQMAGSVTQGARACGDSKGEVASVAFLLPPFRTWKLT